MEFTFNTDFTNILDTTSEDVFGFGSLESVFITQNEIDKAQEKLEPDQQIDSVSVLENIKTRLQIYLEPITELPDSCESCESRESRDSKGETRITLPCNICFQFVEMGRGVLCANESELIYEVVYIGENQKCTYTWSWNLLSQIHIKQDMDSDNDKDSILLITIAETLFIQFKIPFTDNASDLIESVLQLQRDSVSPKSAIQVQDTESYEMQKSEILKIRDEKIQEIENEANQKLKELDMKFQKLNVALDPLHSDPIGICQLCFDLPENIYFQPCGHKVCTTCCHKLQVKKDIYCPWDRLKISVYAINNLN